MQELVDENDKVMFLVLTNPFTCKIVEAPEMLVEGVEETEDRYSVQFFPWMPLSKEKRISIDPTWVVTIVEPTEMVKESYEGRMNGQ